MDRRKAAGLIGSAGISSLFMPGRVQAQLFGPEVPVRPTFFFGQIAHGEGLSWNPYPTAARSLIEIAMARTSLQASPDRVDLTFDHPRLFYYPFIYWTGTREFEPLTQKQIERLRLYLEMGGFMLVDDALSAQGVGFDKSFQRELSRLFPGRVLRRLPKEHTIHQSYYLLDRIAGRTDNRNYLTGIDIGDRTPLVYSGVDLGGAWARDRTGKWVNEVTPGGRLQRENAIRTGINIIMYALCLNYKQDLIHVPFISERRSGRKRTP